MAENDSTEVLGRDGESGWEDPNIPGESPQTVKDEAFTSTGSEFAVSPEIHKEQGRKNTQGGGQNKKLDPVIGIPDPKFRLFKSDATNPHQRVKSFLNYWNALPQWAKDNTLLYVYRDHPVLKYIERDPDNREQEFNYIDKISGSEPLQDEMDVLNRYGCGNYKLVFNAIEPKKPNRTLCTVYVVNLGNNDFKSNPPTDRRISDSKNVDLEHPNNKAYVAYLRGVGLLPSQIDAIRGESDMASIELVKEQQTTTNKLVDTVVKMAQDTKDRKGDNTDVLEKAMSGAMDIMAKGSEAAIKVTQEANAYASRVREEADTKRASTATPTESPLSLALQIVELMKGGAGSGDAEVVALRAQIDKLRDDQVNMLRDELRSMRESRTTNVSSNPFDNMKAGMDSLKQFKELTDELSGAGDKGSVAEDVADAAGAPKWLVRFAPLIQQGMQLVDGFFRMRMAQMPMPPGYPPQPGQPGYPLPQWNGPGYPPQPQPAPMSPTPGPQLVQARHPLATLDPAQFTPELTQLLTAIAVPLGVHLEAEDTGTTFAEWFMSGFGEDTHTQVVQFGTEGIVAALYSFPATLQSVQGFPAEKVQEFVAEFLNPQFEDQGTGGDESPEPETDPKTPVVA